MIKERGFVERIAGSILLVFVLVFMMPLSFAAGQGELHPEEFLPGSGENEGISSLEGWDQVEQYWYELEREMGEFLPSWKFSDIWKRDGEGFVPGLRDLSGGLLRFLFAEVVTNLDLMGQLILLAVAASLLKSLQGSFGSEEVARLTEAVAFFVLLGLALRSFTLAVDIGRGAVDNMVNFMFALLPVLLTLMASMGHITSAALFHPLIIFSVNFMASMIRNVIFPLIFFATILYLVNHFSPHFKINRLADLFKDISIWALGLMLTIFLGLTAIQGVAGGMGDALALRTAKFMTGSFIPVVGKMLADAVDTVLGYSLLLKNSVTITGLIMLALIIVFPLLKLLSLILIYKVCGALIQPLGETTLGDALSTMANCLSLVFAAVATVALTFFISIAIILGVSNAAVMLR